MGASAFEGSVRAASPCIWAIGGGKGGVGKSVITSNLAIALANRGVGMMPRVTHIVVFETSEFRQGAQRSMCYMADGIVGVRKKLS